MRWDTSGRPSRSEATAARDYDDGVGEMRELLARGRTMDDLWTVANGVVKVRGKA